MKRLYWRPQRVSFRVLLVLSLCAIAGLVSVELVRTVERQPFYSEKVRAARLALRAFDAIKVEKQRLKIPIDPESDPAQVGMIGELLTPATTNPGHLPAKQTSQNPNFAAVVVHMLKRAGVEEGDKIGVGMSGSFPSMNISVLAAIEALKLDAVVISSAGSSQWGSNQPFMMWPDMERILNEQKILTTRSVAFSRGGVDDRALGLSKEGRQMIDEAIRRNGYRHLEVKNFEDGVEKRFQIYREMLGEDEEYKAYINVGGGTTSVGTRVGKRMYKPGLNRSIPGGAAMLDSVMTRFAREGVPIIHLVKIDTLAERYGLPLQPTVIPPVGEGKIFERAERNKWLTVGVLVGLLVLLWAFVRMDWGYRMLTPTRQKSGSGRPEQMV